MPSKMIFSLSKNLLLVLIVNSIFVVPLCIYKKVSGIPPYLLTVKKY